MRGPEVTQETELDRAFRSTLAILTKVEPGHLDASTPCASWNVRALINHFVGTARWWASMVTGEGDVPRRHRVRRHSHGG